MYGSGRFDASNLLQCDSKCEWLLLPMAEDVIAERIMRAVCMDWVDDRLFVATHI